jgi:hypothetical protein
MDTALRMAHFAPCMHPIACLGDYFFFNSTRLAAGFLCLRACSNGPRGAARTQLGSSRLRAPFALRSYPSRECTTAGSSHTRQMQQPGVGPRYSEQLRLSHEYQPRGGTNLPAAAAALLEHCANAAARCTRPTLALASFVHGQYSNHGADGGSRT